MSRQRSFVAYLLMAVLIIGHLFDAITYREHWPFSNYPMFTSVMPASVTQYQIACLTYDAAGEEVPMVVRSDWLPSLPNAKLQKTLHHIIDGTPDPQRLRRLLEDYLTTYEAYRLTGRSGSPPAHGMRVYRLEVPLQIPLQQVSLLDPRCPYVKMALEVRQGEVHSKLSSPEKLNLKADHSVFSE